MIEGRQRQDWINKARQGDPLAVSKLLAAYHAVLRARADARLDRSLRAKLEPEDILQEVYFQVVRQINRFEGRSPNSFFNWVLTILDNRLINARQALQRQRCDVAREIRPQAANKVETCWNLLDQLYADSVTPSRGVRREEAVDALLACMSHLSNSHRQVLQLRFLEEHSVDEVAKRLGKSKGAVVALTIRALAALRKSMDCLGEFTRGA